MVTKTCYEQIGNFDWTNSLLYRPWARYFKRTLLKFKSVIDVALDVTEK